MTKRSLLIVILCLYLCISVNGKTEWNYTRKELINFTWGNGQYQLGTDYFSNIEDMSQIYGPSALAIDHCGMFYIFDAVNERIIKFDSNGKFVKSKNDTGYSEAMGFDSKGQLYVEHDGNQVEIYDADLNLIDRIRYGPYNYQPKKIWINDKEGIITLHNNIRNGYIYNNEPKITKKFGKNTVEYSPSTLTDELYIKIINNIAYIPLPVANTTIKINLSEPIFDMDLVKEKDNYIFMQVTVMDEDYSKRRLLYIYNSDQLIQKLILDNDDEMYFFQQKSTYLISIDKNFNIYHLLILKSGPKLIKWEKK